MRRCWIAWVLILATAAIAGEKLEPGEGLPSIGEKTSGMEKRPGYFPFYWDARQGKIWIEIGRWDEAFLYVESLPAGIGSNEIGLDRGQLGRSRVVKFQRIGPRVVLIQPNLAFRAESDRPAERRAVEEAFAQSVLWGFQVEAEQDGHALIDATDFLMRDAHGVAKTLKNADQGDYALEPSRSVFFLERTKNFPLNSEFEAMLTFVGKEPGALVRGVVPSPDSITVRQHHSLIQLPGPEYRPRAFDPRTGFSFVSYRDYAAPIGEPIVKRLITRHRLIKKNPEALIGEPVEPIVYYVDRGVPEPIRSALIEGASWWAEAFEDAGFRNAFRVELLPEDADPMDVRYNVIQWVHRSTRGWSYGASVHDPRTGEIIKGHVTLGSLRVRQDYLIAEALLAPYGEGEPITPEMENLALARLRQLAAHEVGHTLGLAHNFAASARGRASVMDYPHPKIGIREDGSFDLSDAYGIGIGDWDRFAIGWGYRQPPDGEEESQALEAMVREALDRDLVFISDRDARPSGAAHPLANLWDNGVDPVDELDHILEVRRIALGRFSEKNIRAGAPMATLEEVLVPLYMFHRYQVEAACKPIGGLNYTYALRGDGQWVTDVVPAPLQRRALRAVLRTLKPEVLALPESIIALIAPRPHGFRRTRESFPARTGAVFDPISAAEAAADLTLGFVLDPDRAARLVQFSARDEGQLDFGDVIDELFEATWKARRKQRFDGAIQRVVEQTILERLIDLAVNSDAAAQVRATALLKLEELGGWLEEQLERTISDAQRAHTTFALSRIKLLLEDPTRIESRSIEKPPPGSPIGVGGDDFCGWTRENTEP